MTYVIRELRGHPRPGLRPHGRPGSRPGNMRRRGRRRSGRGPRRWCTCSRAAGTRTGRRARSVRGSPFEATAGRPRPSTHRDHRRAARHCESTPHRCRVERRHRTAANPSDSRPSKCHRPHASRSGPGTVRLSSVLRRTRQELGVPSLQAVSIRPVSAPLGDGERDSVHVLQAVAQHRAVDFLEESPIDLHHVLR